MMDELAKTSEFDFFAAFTWAGHGRYKELPRPKIAKSIFLRPKTSMAGKEPPFYRAFHEDWRSDLFAEPFDAAIISGYGGATQREAIQECRRRGIPVALFSDSNLRSQRGRNCRAKLWRKVKRRFIGPIIRNVDCILTANNLGVAYWRYYGAPKAKVVRCPYYADYVRIQTARESDRAKVFSFIPLDPAQKLIITAARLVPEKGLHLMINAFRKSGLGAKGWTFAIAGTGPLENELKALSGDDLGRSIRFLGFVQPSQLLALIHHSAFFALPSVYEPHGIVVQESLACETPVLSSDVVGASYDLVIPNRTGWVFKSEDEAALLRVLLNIAADEPNLAAMRPLSRAYFEEWLALTNPVTVADQIARDLLAQKRSP